MIKHRYRIYSTKSGVVLCALPIIITTIFVCIINFIKYKSPIPFFIGIFIILLYFIVCKLITEISYCTITDEAILMFIGQSFLISSIKICDIKDVNIKKSIGRRLNYGSNEIVITTNKKNVRIGILECDKFIKELEKAIDLFKNK